MSGLFGSSTSQVNTGTNSNVDWLQPYWQQWLQQGLGAIPSSMPVYGGPRVAPMNLYQNTGADMMGQVATNGTPAGNAANSAISSIADGSQANPYIGLNNPALQSVIQNSNNNIADAFARGTGAQTRAAFGSAGGFGGSAYQEQQAANDKTLAQQLAANTDNLNYGAYLDSANTFANDRAAQLSAAGLGLGSQMDDAALAQGLFGIGGAYQGNTQANMDALQSQFNEQTMAPITALQLQGSMLGQASGAPASNTSTSSISNNPNWLQIMLGLGSLGYGSGIFR